MPGRKPVETLLIIGLGGFIGANVRYLVGGLVAGWLGTGFPWGTLIINFTGSLLLAVFVAWAAAHTQADPRLRLFMATGFFGAYTTFSTYSLETLTLLQAGNWTGAAINVLITNSFCLLGAIAGFALGSRL